MTETQGSMEVIGTDFENWAPYLMKQFQFMYEKGERCDLEISCNKQIFLVHRLIMSACSEYVKELGDKQHIILPEEVSCKALKTVLDFVYSGKIVFNKEEKDDLLLASNLLNMRLLTELIKMEESCSFTLSMDDEADEKSEENVSTEAAPVEIPETPEEILPDQSKNEQISNKVQYKKKETRGNRRSNRHAVLPPLHKFPYLQQKFSASRTYGLITTLTEPIPSRFEIPSSMPLENVYRSSFEDVSYETEGLCNEEDTFSPLESNHQQFLKKMKETTVNKRSYSNALYSPFDKYTPPYTVHSEITSRKREATSSYLLKNDPVPAKRNVQPPPPAPKASEPKKVVTSYSSQNSVASTAVVNQSTTVTPPLLPAPLQNSESITMLQPPEVIATYSHAQPAPKSPEIIEVPSIENGEKVELIKLNNAIVRTVDTKGVNEETPDVSISVIGNETNVVMGTATAVQEPLLANELVPAVLPTSAPPTLEVDMPPAKKELTETANDDSNSTEVTELDALNDHLPMEIDTAEVKEDTCENVLPNDVADTNDFAVPEANTEDVTVAEKSACSINSSQVSDIISDSNSTFIAVNTKGTESQAQINRIIEDLRKKSPLLKDKNVRVQIVSVKGPISGLLKDQARAGASLLNKAIIVKKTENASKPNNTTKDVENQEVRKMYVAKSLPIENVAGPWECKPCGNSTGSPMKLDTYFEYRTHIHDVHSEPNNPVYCIHCGFKSLKRNAQLYHLFTKHNVEPPPNFKFPKCNKCDYFALNDYALQKHLLSCHPSIEMEFPCSCKLVFKTSEEQQKHITSGDCKNSKSFSCGYCKCSFDRFVNLKAHMRLCMKERSKPVLQSATENFLPEPSNKTISEGGKDYLAL